MITPKKGNNRFEYYFWIPIVGPLIGALLGAYLYKFIVGNVLQRLSDLPRSQGDAEIEELKALNNE